jgi:serine protease Do
MALTTFLVVFMICAFATPSLVARWRAIEGRAEAEAVYQKRRAELRAEADAAEDMLKLLDKRIDLTSLGFRQVARKVSPIVVSLASYAQQRDPHSKDSKNWPETTDLETGQPAYLTGSGSGVIVEPNWILTNFHVIQNAHRLRVTFASGHTVSVDEDRIKTDPLTDLAVIHLPAAAPGVLREDHDVKAEFADSDAVERGDLVLALGNPLGLKHTATHGIISAKGRLLGPLDATEVLQTDAPINKGNSGGPLFDHHGRVIGINFAIASDNEFYQGIGFAIPSNIAKEVFRQLKDNGEVERGYLGVRMVELPRKQAQELTKGGAIMLDTVEPYHAASKAKLQVRDVIVVYNGELLSASNPRRHLRQLIMESKVNSTVDVVIVRDGQRLTVPVVVGKRPPEPRKKAP